jgi:hypothetical protein
MVNLYSTQALLAAVAKRIHPAGSFKQKTPGAQRLKQARNWPQQVSRRLFLARIGANWLTLAGLFSGQVSESEFRTMT